MADIKGDPLKKTAECLNSYWKTCANAKSVREGWESETYECAVCGERYTLYDDEMK